MYLNELNQIFQVNALLRQQMTWQAIRLVENTCDDWVINGLVNEAVFDSSGNHTIETAIRTRLENGFQQAREDLSRRQVFDRIFACCINDLPEVIRNFKVQIETDRQNIGWPVVLATYRHAHSELEREIGFYNNIPA